MTQVDVLAFGAHADDVEIGMAGSISKWAQAGRKIVICDLTQAELSSNGTVDTRVMESRNAAEKLGVLERVNLQMPDRGLFLTDERIGKIVEVIRKYKPRLIFAPFPEDRHPDHGNCAALVREAFFSAGIRKYKAEHGESPHKAQNLFFYFINSQPVPDFAVDISKHMDKKIEALKAYKSQFTPGPSGVKTPLTEGYLERVEAREKMYGMEAGVAFAEGFKTTQLILVNNELFGESL